MATEAEIKRMAERFLNWPLPKNFHPDAGISFEPVYNKGTQYEGRHNPTGTNLFGLDDAVAMVRHMVQDDHASAPPSKEHRIPLLGGGEATFRALVGDMGAASIRSSDLPLDGN